MLGFCAWPRSAGRVRRARPYARLLDRFARLLAVTLYRSEVYHRATADFRAIKEMGRLHHRSLPVEEICSQVLQLALRVLQPSRVVGLLASDRAAGLVAHRG